MLRQLQARISSKARRRRGQFLMRVVDLPLNARILDLGGATGRHIHDVLPSHSDITVCDISEQALKAARETYGYKTVLLQESGTLPFHDKEFDFCFCSSVIEHVTAPKHDVWKITGDAAFRSIARERQGQFAREIARVAKRFYVQTPYRYFFIESHTCLPGIIVLLPRRLQIALFRFINRFWFASTDPEWYLLDWREMAETFPDAKIYGERYLCMTKSLMAVKA